MKYHWTACDVSGITGLGVLSEVVRKIHGIFGGEIFINRILLLNKIK